MVTTTRRITISLAVYTVIFSVIKCNESVAINDPQGKAGEASPDVVCPSENPRYPVMKPHERDCEKFYVCDTGVPHLRFCQPGLHFNPKVQTCDYPENAGCDTSVTRKPQGRIGDEGSNGLCPLTNKGKSVLKPHETDCRKFYACDEGTTHLQVCQHGLHFNAKRQMCDYPENAGCVTTVTKRPKGKVGREGFENVCSADDGNSDLKPHETDCRKFYICNGGIPHVQTCQHGLHFNPRKQACDYPENAGCETSVPQKEPKGKEGLDDFNKNCPNVRIGKTVLLPHPTDCSKFVMCDSGVSHIKSCPSGLHFSSTHQLCDYPSNVRCNQMGRLQYAGVPSPFCPETNRKTPVFYRHASNCSIYYMCSNGLAYEFVCPARLHFNLRRNVCDYEDIAQCSTGASSNKDEP